MASATTFSSPEWERRRNSGEHPCRRVDGQSGVDVPRVDALYVDRASAGAGCWLPGGRLRNVAIGLLRRVR